jgi:hypothetical protein
MIQLTEEQRRELRETDGESGRVVDPQTKQEYVLVRAEVYERLKGLLSEDTVFTTTEQLDAVMADADAGS